MKTFSIVVPIYHNEKNLGVTIPAFLDFSKDLKNYNIEMLFVDDGSSDKSLKKLVEYQRKHPEIIKVIKLTRNYGQRFAIMAGVEFSTGDVIGFISADMQDPISLFKEMLKDWENGKKLVLAVRNKRNDGKVNDFFSKTFYKLVRKIAIANYPDGGSDFCIMDRKVADKLTTYKEKNNHLMMSILNLGFDYSIHTYERKKRELGESQFNFWKKINVFLNSIITNSYIPIRLVAGVGVISSFLSFIYFLFILISWFFGETNSENVKGWTSLAILITFFGGIILMALGIIGEYIWRIYSTVRNTPLFVIDEIFDDSK